MQLHSPLLTFHTPHLPVLQHLPLPPVKDSMSPEKSPSSAAEDITAEQETSLTASFWAFLLTFVAILIMAVSYRIPQLGWEWFGFGRIETVTIAGMSPENFRKQYPNLVTTVKTDNKPLLEELGRILTAGEGPDSVYPPISPNDFNTDSNPAVRLELVFGRDSESNSQQLSSLFARIPPSESWSIPSAIVKTAVPMLQSRTPELQELRTLLDSPQSASFSPMYVDTLDEGKQPARTFFDSLDEFVMLEELNAAAQLEKNNCDAAVETVLRLLRLAELSGQTKNLTIRLFAANLRQKSLRILQTLVRRSDFTDTMARPLLETLARQLSHWPSDGNSLVGDRLSGLFVYEQARKGRLFESLTTDEVILIEAQSNSGSLYKNLAKTLETDQLFYLKSMQSLIAATAKPHCDRKDVYEEIGKSIAVRRGLPEYPMIAAILLDGLTGGMEQLAEDRMRTEMWTIGFAKRLGRPYDNTAKDPVFGQPYQVAEIPNPIKPTRPTIRVSAGESGYFIEIP